MSDIVIGKAGDSMSGRILNPTIVFEGGFGPVEYPRDEIWSIEIDVPYAGHGPDEIRLRTADRSRGTMVTEPIEFEDESSGQTFQIPRDRIKLLRFGLLFDRNARRLDE